MVSVGAVAVGVGAGVDVGTVVGVGAGVGVGTGVDVGTVVGVGVGVTVGVEVGSAVGAGSVAVGAVEPLPQAASAADARTIATTKQSPFLTSGPFRSNDPSLSKLMRFHYVNSTIPV